MSRAWTFQEGLFSRRRIIFTDSEVYFECHEFNWQESWASAPSQYLRTHGQLHNKSWRTENIFYPGLTRRAPDIIYCIEEYSRRSISYSTDIINAICGVFAWYQVNTRFDHHWGVPLLERFPRISVGNISDQSLQFSFGLCWTLTLASGFGNSRPVRRPCTPSWSWAGWAHEIVFWPHLDSADNRLSRYSNACMTRYKMMDIQIECLDGAVVNWKEYKRMASTGQPPRLSCFLHISSWTIPVIVRQTPPGVSDIHGTYPMYTVIAEICSTDWPPQKRNQQAFFTMPIDSLEPPPEKCILVQLIETVVPPGTDEDEVPYPTVLLVGERRGNLERLGIYSGKVHIYENKIQSSSLSTRNMSSRDYGDLHPLYELCDSTNTFYAYRNMRKVWETIRLG
ncbi:hypothetical protein B0O99DRAFT_634786 [Bisporella sp. PMI_857]|nr:hypothetical protein B0O99DRAFT_634786 [Bisporella sp. PMI_857]